MITHIRQLIEHDINRSHYDDKSHYHRIIPAVYGVHDQFPEPRPPEYRLDDNAASHERTDLQTHDRQNMTERISDNIDSHVPLLNAPHSHTCHIILIQLVDELGAHLPDEPTAHRDREGQDR